MIDGSNDDKNDMNAINKVNMVFEKMKTNNVDLARNYEILKYIGKILKTLQMQTLTFCIDETLIVLYLKLYLRL